MREPRVLFGFHAILARLRAEPKSVVEIFLDETRHDGRIKDLAAVAERAGVKVMKVPTKRLDGFYGGGRHQGVVARIETKSLSHSLDEILENVKGSPLLLLLDGVTDPHNLGACLRVADGAGVQAVIAPKDHAVGINATVAKVASGAAETVPYLMVTNLSRTIAELKSHHVRVIGAAEDAPATLYETDLTGPVALVLGAEGAGLRQLTRRNCDALVRIPLHGAVESLNVSVAAGVCLFEARRQRNG